MNALVVLFAVVAGVAGSAQDGLLAGAKDAQEMGIGFRVLFAEIS